MQLDKIIALTAKKQSPTETVIASLATITYQALGAIGANFPATAQQFQSLAEQIKRVTEEYERAQLDPLQFFSGKGTVANALRSYIAMREFVEDVGVPLQTKAILDKFDFKPITSGEEHKQFVDLLSNVVKKMREHTFTMFKPTKYFDRNKIELLESGFYGKNESSGENYVVLRVELPDTNGVIAVYRACLSNGYMNEPASLFLYHPFEKVWINSTWMFTLPGLNGLLEAEFNKMFDAARPLAPDFIYRDEATFMQGMAQALFSKAEFLPKQLYHTLAGGVSENNGFNQHTTVFRQNDEEMVVYYKGQRASIKFCQKAGTAMATKETMYWVDGGLTAPLPDQEDVIAELPTSNQIDLLKHVGSALMAFMDAALRLEAHAVSQVSLTKD